MSSTYSTNLAIELIGTGDQAGSWGNTTNTNLGTLIEQAISGYVTQAVSTGTDTTITIPNGATGVARNMYIELTGTGGTNTNLIVPANKKLYFIYNNSTGAVTVKVSGQTGVSVPTGKKMVLVSDGTDIVNGLNYIADFGTNSFTVTNLTATSASITTLTGTSANITTLSGTTATFTSATVTNLSLTSLTLSNLSIASANITTLTSGSATITNLINSGGTANGVLYLNGSKVATSGSALVFDGTNLGIGTTSPATRLEVVGASAGSTVATFTSNETGSTTSLAVFQRSGGAVAAAVKYNASNSPLTIDFGTTTNHGLTFLTNNTERARIDSSGNLGIGTASPAVKLEVSGSAGAVAATIRAINTGTTSSDYAIYQLKQGSGSTWQMFTGANSDTLTFGRSGVGDYLYLNNSGNLGLGVTPSAWVGMQGGVFQNAGSGSLFSRGVNEFCVGFNAYYNSSTGFKYINSRPASNYQQTDGAHLWYTAASGTADNAITFTQVLAVEGGKSLALEGATSQSGTGITFPATQSASSNANTLDDYEEGTFTPIVKGRTTAGTGTYVYQFGSYVKVGKLVTASVFIEWSAHTGTGQMVFAGLPFNATTTALYNAAAAFSFVDNIALTANNVLTGNINQTNNDGVNCWQYPVGGGGSTTVPVDSAGSVIFTISYEV